LNQNLDREQPVEVQEKRFGYFPKSFRWHGKRYDVQAIERTWSRDFAAWNQAISNHASTRKNGAKQSRRAPRLYFRVRCHDGIFDLCQDLRADTWHLSAMHS
jgi:hypothetical protein